MSLYTDDAGVRIVVRNNTPSSPRELRGKEEIGEYLRDVFSRDTTHQLEREITAKDRVAFNVAVSTRTGPECWRRKAWNCERARLLSRWKW